MEFRDGYISDVQSYIAVYIKQCSLYIMTVNVMLR